MKTEVWSGTFRDSEREQRGPGTFHPTGRAFFLGQGCVRCASWTACIFFIHLSSCTPHYHKHRIYEIQSHQDNGGKWSLLRYRIGADYQVGQSQAPNA